MTAACGYDDRNRLGGKLGEQPTVIGLGGIETPGARARGQPSKIDSETERGAEPKSFVILEFVL